MFRHRLAVLITITTVGLTAPVVQAGKGSLVRSLLRSNKGAAKGAQVAGARAARRGALQAGRAGSGRSAAPTARERTLKAAVGTSVVIVGTGVATGAAAAGGGALVVGWKAGNGVNSAVQDVARNHTDKFLNTGRDSIVGSALAVSLPLAFVLVLGVVLYHRRRRPRRGSVKTPIESNEVDPIARA